MSNDNVWQHILDEVQKLSVRVDALEELLNTKLDDALDYLEEQQSLNDKLLQHPQVQALLNTLEDDGEYCDGNCDECEDSSDCWDNLD